MSTSSYIAPQYGQMEVTRLVALAKQNCTPIVMYWDDDHRQWQYATETAWMTNPTFHTLPARLIGYVDGSWRDRES